MITIAICDDNENMIYEIKELLMENCQELQTVFDIHTYDKGKKLEQSIYQGMSFDLLYLDIQMEDQDGIETARNIRRLAPDVFIIYISGYDRYIEEVFDVSASNFIRKPIKKERFQKTLRQVSDKIRLPFIRVHQSFLVNFEFIKNRARNEITMVTGDCIPVSRDHQKQFIAQYTEYLGREIHE